MKMDPEGKAKLGSILLTMYPAEPLRNVLIHESGEMATVQIADKYFRYRLSPIAKEILRGHKASWTDTAELFTLVK